LPAIPAGGHLELAGTAHDNYAIGVVRWYDAKDWFGTAKLVWEAADSRSPDMIWVTRWRIRGARSRRGSTGSRWLRRTSTGLASVRRMTVRR
jgi:hypothetical protein